MHSERQYYLDLEERGYAFPRPSPPSSLSPRPLPSIMRPNAKRRAIREHTYVSMGDKLDEPEDGACAAPLPPASDTPEGTHTLTNTITMTRVNNSVGTETRGCYTL